MKSVNNANNNGEIEQKQYNLQSVHAISIMTFVSSPFLICHVTLGDGTKQQRIKETLPL